MEIKTLEKIFKICIFIIFISILFDISVTYIFYKKDTANFLVFEGHRNLVGELKEKIPFFNTISVKVMLICPILLFFIISFFKDFPKLYKLFLLFTIPVLLIGSFLHILGGLSWLI